MVFDQGRKGIRMHGTEMEVIELGGAPGSDSLGVQDCLVWNESLDNPATAFLAAQLQPPHFPTPLGVFRSVEATPYETLVNDQVRQETERKGPGDLAKLIYSGDIWTVQADNPAS